LRQSRLAHFAGQVRQLHFVSTEGFTPGKAGALTRIGLDLRFHGQRSA
jgi:hypothetical protein